MELSGKNVLVVGLGRSGVGAADLCQRRGARVTATDRRDAQSLTDAVQKLQGRVKLELSGHQVESFTGADLIVLSPGVPEIAPIKQAREAGVQIIGELELAYRHVAAPVVAITGTNGKSTTTSMLGAMLEATGRPTFTGGNLGAPLVEAVDSSAASSGGALVLELSSFQLETVETFHAQVALLLNLSEDHLDRYPDYQSYLAAKARIFERQTAEDHAVLCGEPDQDECIRLAARTCASRLTFQLDPARLTSDAHVGAWLDKEQLCVRVPGGPVESISWAALRLPGRHNVQNALAALLGARLAGAGIEACHQALASFKGLPHRMELVAEAGGVRFFNDSKATNVGAVVGSLSGFEMPVVLIAGGKDKGGEYEPLARLLGQIARHVVLIGAAADRMERALTGAVPLHRGRDLPHAVELAASLANAGDAVVLSPACSSFDMFDNYEHRGEVFAAAARKLHGGGA